MLTRLEDCIAQGNADNPPAMPVTAAIPQAEPSGSSVTAGEG
jgi:hypothetical protein